MRTILIFCLLTTSSVMVQAQWMQLPGPEGGQIVALTTLHDTIFAATPGQGVFRYTDADDVWEPKNDGLDASTSGLSQHVVYTAFGKLFLGSGSGIFVSVDGGETWEYPSSAPFTGVYDFMLYHDSLFATGGLGPYVSTDQGVTWATLNNGPLASFVRRRIVSAGDRIITSGDDRKVYSSTDAGQNWVQQTDLITAPTSLLAVDSIVIAGTNYYLQRSSDYGATWSTHYLGAYYLGTALIEFGGKVIAGSSYGLGEETSDGQLWSSSDTGKTWSQMSTWPSGVGLLSLAARGSQLLAGTTDGVYSSADSGATWTQMNDHLSAIGSYGLIAIGDTLFTNPIGLGILASTDAGNTWFSSDSGIVEHSIMCLRQIGSTLYAGGTGHIYASTNMGAAWDSLASGIPPDANIASIAGDTSRLLAGAYKSLYVLSSEATSWESATGIPDDWVSAVWLEGMTGIAGTAAYGVYRSTDGGLSWGFSGSGMSLPISLGFGDFIRIESKIFTSTGDGIFTSTDDGLTWSLQAEPANSDKGRNLFVRGTNLFLSRSNGNGIAFSADGGRTWTSISDGLPTNANTDYRRISGNNQSLFLASAAGLWRRPLGEIALSTNLTLAPSSLDFGDVSVDSSRTIMYTVTNDGIDSLFVTDQNVNDDAFHVVSSAWTLAPGESRTDTVIFTPVEPAFSSGHLVFLSNSWTQPDTIPVSGTGHGARISFDKTFVQITNTEFGTFKDAIILVSNPGNDALRVDSVTSTHPDFTLHPETFSVAPGDSLADTLRFTPTAGFMQYGTLVYSSNAVGVTDTISVQGYGFGTRVLTFESDTVDFGAVRTGTERDTLILFTNTGSDTLRITDMRINSEEFSTPDTAFTLLPGESRGHHFIYSPHIGSRGDAQVSVSFKYIDPSFVHDLFLRGYGAEAVILLPHPQELAFGSVPLTTHAMLPILVSADGSDTLRVKASPPADPTFTIRGNDSLSLLPGESDTLWVQYTPVDGGVDSAYVILTSNDPESPDSVLVWGMGTTETEVPAAEGVIPDVFSLDQNYPNPFNPTTSISFGLPQQSSVLLEVYTVLGQKISTVTEGQLPAGFYSRTWHATGPSGLYIYRLEAVSLEEPSKKFIGVKKMVLLR